MSASVTKSQLGRRSRKMLSSFEQIHNSPGRQSEKPKVLLRKYIHVPEKKDVSVVGHDPRKKSGQGAVSPVMEPHHKKIKSEISPSESSPDVGVPVSSVYNTLTRNLRSRNGHHKTPSSSSKTERPSTSVSGRSQTPKCVRTRSRNKTVDKATATRNPAITRSKDPFSDRDRHFREFGYRSHSPDEIKQTINQQRFVMGSAAFDECERMIQRHQFDGCFERRNHNELKFQIGEDVLFLSERCYRKGKVTSIRKEPVPLQNVPPELIEKFTKYSVVKYPMEVYGVEFYGATNRKDTYHMEYIPVYELFPLIPNDKWDANMLLYAYHYNDCAPLVDPVAHHKARYASYFWMDPHEYVSLQEKWREWMGVEITFLEFVAYG